MVGHVETGKSFGGLANYIGGEDKDYVAWRDAFNLGERTASGIAREMEDAALANSRVKDPLRHVVISFHKSESPTPETMNRAAQEVLKDLGLGKHQAFLAAHDDGEQSHLHVMVNRVPADGKKAWDPHHEGLRLRGAIERIERKMDLIKTGHNRKRPRHEGKPARHQNAKQVEQVNKSMKNDTEADALNFAARHFHENLMEASEDHPAHRYLTERGFAAEDLRRFGIGYARDEWDGLKKAARSKGFTGETLEQAGLLKRRRRGEGRYDRFRGRITFPVRDERGQVRGFGARRIEGIEIATESKTESPKYINSPQGVLYKKSELFFGRKAAGKAMRERGEVVIVEGYTDAVRLVQSGYPNVLALAGTRLTEEHAGHLARHVSRATIVLDGDEGGRRAAGPAALKLMKAGVRPHIVELPDGMDVDEFVRSRGGKAFATYSEAHAATFADALLRSALEQEAQLAERQDQKARSEAVVKAEATAEALSAVASLESSKERARYFEQVAKASQPMSSLSPDQEVRHWGAVGSMLKRHLDADGRDGNTVPTLGNSASAEDVLPHAGSEAAMFYRTLAEHMKRATRMRPVSNGRRERARNVNTPGHLISEAKIEEVKRANPILDVARNYTRLKEEGDDRWKGLSPFRREENPSFEVRPSENVYYDYGEGKGGDQIRLVQRMERVDFREAIQHLADRVDIDLEVQQASKSREGQVDQSERTANAKPKEKGTMQDKRSHNETGRILESRAKNSMDDDPKGEKLRLEQTRDHTASQRGLKPHDLRRAAGVSEEVDHLTRDFRERIKDAGDELAPETALAEYRIELADRGIFMAKNEDGRWTLADKTASGSGQRVALNDVIAARRFGRLAPEGEGERVARFRKAAAGQEGKKKQQPRKREKVEPVGSEKGHALESTAEKMEMETTPTTTEHVEEMSGEEVDTPNLEEMISDEFRKAYIHTQDLVAAAEQPLNAKNSGGVSRERVLAIQALSDYGLQLDRHAKEMQRHLETGIVSEEHREIMARQVQGSRYRSARVGHAVRQGERTLLIKARAAKIYRQSGDASVRLADALDREGAGKVAQRLRDEPELFGSVRGIGVGSYGSRTRSEAKEEAENLATALENAHRKEADQTWYAVSAVQEGDRRFVLVHQPGTNTYGLAEVRSEAEWQAIQDLEGPMPWQGEGRRITLQPRSKGLHRANPEEARTLSERHLMRQGDPPNARELGNRRTEHHAGRRKTRPELSADSDPSSRGRRGEDRDDERGRGASPPDRADDRQRGAVGDEEGVGRDAGTGGKSEDRNGLSGGVQRHRGKPARGQAGGGGAPTPDVSGSGSEQRGADHQSDGGRYRAQRDGTGGTADKSRDGKVPRSRPEGRGAASGAGGTGRYPGATPVQNGNLQGYHARRAEAISRQHSVAYGAGWPSRGVRIQPASSMRAVDAGGPVSAQVAVVVGRAAREYAHLAGLKAAHGTLKEIRKSRQRAAQEIRQNAACAQERFKEELARTYKHPAKAQERFNRLFDEQGFERALQAVASDPERLGRIKTNGTASWSGNRSEDAMSAARTLHRAGGNHLAHAAAMHSLRKSQAQLARLETHQVDLLQKEAELTETLREVFRSENAALEAFEVEAGLNPDVPAYKASARNLSENPERYSELRGKQAGFVDDRTRQAAREAARILPAKHQAYLKARQKYNQIKTSASRAQEVLENMESEFKRVIRKIESRRSATDIAKDVVKATRSASAQDRQAISEAFDLLAGKDDLPKRSPKVIENLTEWVYEGATPEERQHFRTEIATVAQAQGMTVPRRFASQDQDSGIVADAARGVYEQTGMEGRERISRALEEVQRGSVDRNTADKSKTRQGVINRVKKAFGKDGAPRDDAGKPSKGLTNPMKRFAERVSGRLQGEAIQMARDVTGIGREM